MDALIFPEANSFSISMVLRDHNGQFSKGKVVRFLGCVLVFKAEAVGMQEALVWPSEIPCTSTCSCGV